MAYTSKVWKDRIVQYLNRRKLTDVDTGDIRTVTVARDEGGITEEGDIFNAATMNDLEARIQAAFDSMHPVGSIYMSVNNVNPSTLFGGTWVEWGAGRVPVGVDTTQTEFDTVEETGGAKEVTLTAAQSGVPAHNHTFQGNLSSVEHTGDTLSSGGSFEDRVLVNINYAGRKSTTLVENNTAANASQAHTNLQPYITCYMWKRVS